MEMNYTTFMIFFPIMRNGFYNEIKKLKKC